jgi:hypothetical protein
MMHDNSYNAYVSEIPKMSKRANQIFKFLNENRDIRFTDRDVMIGLGYSEPNQVRPRITELIRTKRVLEVGKKRCETTGKNVRLIQVS